MADRTGTEQRKAPRVDYEVEVDVASEDNFFTGFIRNISSGGLFIHTHDPLPIGRELNVSFTVPTISGSITARAVVRWVRPYGSHAPESVPGMGVQFLDILPGEAIRAINEFIEKRREPEFFDE